MGSNYSLVRVTYECVSAEHQLLEVHETTEGLRNWACGEYVKERRVSAAQRGTAKRRAANKA